MKINTDPIKVSRVETMTYCSSAREEYYQFSWKGYDCEEAFSYEEVCALHELTGQMIAEHKMREDYYEQK